MDRRHFLTVLTAAAMITAPAKADAVSDIMSQLREQGFTRIEVSRTLLGRTRILARSVQYRREIVLNDNTGEILRDYWQVLSSTDPSAGPRIADPSGRMAPGGGSGGRDDDDDDDRGRGRGRGRGGDDDDGGGDDD
ncbi:hypothetical protein [Maritimibacter sp. DP1N21-5]|uniref:hypothetical protein n=1 Tax=Maritimibacter sp. DP1N21-5 TaxID=2836867 RepID=UPI001C48E369|nr:hypothetical protein [Maritimibacter sp. DP1N21-5]MBV7408650.1 hypothetical protein [Maritimibacter sp. DP1N21-5]